MSNRDVAIAVSGVLMGVLIGAIAMLYAQQSSPLSAQLGEYAYVDLPDEPREYFMKRQASQRVLPADGTRLDSLRPAAVEVEEMEYTGAVVDCDMVEALANAVLSLVPAKRRTLLVRSELEALFGDAAAQCSSPEIEEVESFYRAAPVIRRAEQDCLHPDYCYIYSGTRRSHCLVEQSNGICYQPGQTPN